MVNCSHFISELSMRYRSLSRTKQLHGVVVVCGLLEHSFYGTKLVRFYDLNDDITSAREVFEHTTERTVFLWNSIIRAYARAHRSSIAFHMYQRMIGGVTCPDSFTLACLVRASQENFDLDVLRHVHGASVIHGFESNSICCSALVTAYSKLRLMGEATTIFNQVSVPDLVLWNTIIFGCTNSGDWSKGFQFFNKMRTNGRMRPDSYTYTGLISGLMNGCWLQNGLALHGLSLKSGCEHKTHVSSSLVSLYSRFRCMDSAYKLFRGLTRPDMVTWSALIAGYSHSGDVGKVFFLFNDLIRNGVKDDPVLIACVLTAVAQSSFVTLGSSVHCFLLREGHELDVVVSSALITMYSKCGYVSLGLRVFQSLQVRNIVTYNAIISALGVHGFVSKCFELFEEILRNGFRADSATFSALLSACCHSGRITEGRQLYWRMENEFGIEARPEHQIFVVKLLGLTGEWGQAFEFIESLKQPVDISVLEALLSSCCTNGNASLADVVAQKLMKIEKDEARHVVMVSNMYAGEGRWDCSEKIRKKITLGNLKLPGCSWVL